MTTASLTVAAERDGRVLVGVADITGLDAWRGTYGLFTKDPIDIFHSGDDLVVRCGDRKLDVTITDSFTLDEVVKRDDALFHGDVDVTRLYVLRWCEECCQSRQEPLSAYFSVYDLGCANCRYRGIQWPV